ncbi:MULTISPECIES: GbsR/MarR family transcriptional regulator [Micromonospora]|uniref:MarR family transcriptional regulator n=1 Tax=Micromonospora solifontis TaxID=2487138 RepID=A0ABX9WDZ7_9ACTN|nr:MULTISPECIES: MarR family transcriptional regulator [Micromonospora]NES15803.1 MarR family transcriptional regulator [Micromonospora sp. PPF5-17B]NES38070.1 MarR family transcriptional regulator [Micromonospora solifontis]NES56649.1 MarR family transcriptional regulator [Micromonospora sp. PPF5-6]RNL97075.1 MarR family transcriptional regulator [Micromonospora solifontis]
MSETTTGNEPHRRDEEEVHLFVERMAMAFADVGFPRMAGRVLFTVMSADQPLTAAEIGERLGVSAAAVSGAVRYLTQFGMLVREPVKGSRRDHYRMPDNPWYEATITKTGLYKNFIDIANGGVDALLGRTTPAGERVAEMRDFFLFVQEEIDALGERWRARRAATGHGRPADA